MAESLGRRARWTTMLVVAPGAAALFGAATSWALHAAPANSAPTPAPAPSRAQPPADAALLGAKRSATANRQELSRRERQLAGLRAQLAALGASARPARPAVPGGATGPAVGTSNPPAPSPTATNSSTPAPQPTTSAPPPVQTSTGASGAVG